MTDETGTKVAKARIVLEGADEYREHIQQVNADMRNLNDCIQAVNDSMKQLTKTVKGFSSLFQQAESRSDEQTKENGSFEALDDAIEECIQKFRDEKTGTGTGVRVLIAEFEELMFLRTKLLTQKVIAEQQMQAIQ